MKIKGIILLLVLKCSFVQAQLYCDFIESKSFYKQSSFLKSANISKEVIVVQQLKNNILEDSFRILITNFNQNGKPASTFSGSKWHLPTLQDSFDYSGNKLMITSLKDVIPSQKTIDKTKYVSNGENELKNDTVSTGVMRYEWDSINNVKKVFLQSKKAGEILMELIFYDDQGRVSKIDFAPESERVRQSEYIYKKNKLKIYSVTVNGRECNEQMWFNAMGQLVERRVLVFSNREWVTNKYLFTYYDNGLIATETKKKDKELYTVATHYYY